MLARLRAIDPMLFEQVVIDLPVAMGDGGGREEMARAFRRSADNGVDVSAVRDFADSLDYRRATKGVFVATSRFAASAKEAAREGGFVAYGSSAIPSIRPCISGFAGLTGLC